MKSSFPLKTEDDIEPILNNIEILRKKREMKCLTEAQKDYIKKRLAKILIHMDALYEVKAIDPIKDSHEYLYKFMKLDNMIREIVTTKILSDQNYSDIFQFSLKNIPIQQTNLDNFAHSIFEPRFSGTNIEIRRIKVLTNVTPIKIRRGLSQLPLTFFIIDKRKSEILSSSLSVKKKGLNGHH